MLQTLLIIPLIGLSSCVPIIVKDFHSTPGLRHFASNYAVKPVSHLHTFAIPKTYLTVTPKSYVAPIVAAEAVHPRITHVIPAHIPAIIKKDDTYKVAKNDETYDSNPSYSYSYAVNDPNTGDSKSAEERLENGVVRGSYTLSEPDGTIRKVTYTADNVNGFQAKVEKIGKPIYPVSRLLKKPIVASTYLHPLSSYKSGSIHSPGHHSRHYFHK